MKSLYRNTFIYMYIFMTFAYGMSQMTIYMNFKICLSRTTYWAICMYMYITKAVGREDPQDPVVFSKKHLDIFKIVFSNLAQRITHWARFNKSWNKTFLSDGNSSVFK